MNDDKFIYKAPESENATKIADNPRDTMNNLPVDEQATTVFTPPKKQAAGIDPFANDLSAKSRQQRHPEKASQGEQPDDDPSRSRSKAFWATFIPLTFLLVVLSLLLIIAEPWYVVEDNYLPPENAKTLGSETLEVGQSYSFQPLCGENEIIRSIEISDPDILSANENSVTARGEWRNVLVTVTTCESAVPQPTQRSFQLFGNDYSRQYNALRNWLRNLLGIEPEVERTEPRVLNIYQKNFNVVGYPSYTNTNPIYIYANYDLDIDMELAEGEEIIMVTFGPEIANIYSDRVPGDDGYVRFTMVTSEQTGEVTLRVIIGFTKDDSTVASRAVRLRIVIEDEPTFSFENELPDDYGYVKLDKDGKFLVFNGVENPYGD